MAAHQALRLRLPSRTRPSKVSRCGNIAKVIIGSGGSPNGLGLHTNPGEGVEKIRRHLVVCNHRRRMSCKLRVCQSSRASDVSSAAARRSASSFEDRIS